MYLDLLDILRAPGTSVEKPIDIAPVTVEDIEFVEPIRGRVRASNARQNIVVGGTASTSVAMLCGRCLQSFDQPLNLELEASAPLSYFKGQPNNVVRNAHDEGEEDEIDDETAAIFDAHSVDVLELIRQATVLQWPIQPLCAEDCPGLPEAPSYESGPDERWNSLKDWNGDAEEEQN